MTANGENLAGGMGLTVSTAEALFAAGVDVITRGNHIWDKREIYPYLERERARPAPAQLRHPRRARAAAGASSTRLDGTELAVINLQGRTYMQPIENPFTDADRLLDEASEPLPPVRLVDFHCELTCEKNALGALPRRARERRRRHPHPRRHGRRADPAQGHGVPDRPRHDRAARSVIGFDPRPSCRGSSTRCRRGSRSATGRSCSTPAQIDIDPATGRALQIERIQRLIEPG